MKLAGYNRWCRAFAFIPRYMEDTEDTIWLEFYWKMNYISPDRWWVYGKQYSRRKHLPADLRKEAT